MTQIRALSEDIARMAGEGDRVGIASELLGWTQHREVSLIRAIRRAEAEGLTVEQVLVAHEARIAEDAAVVAEARRTGFLQRARDWARCPGCGEVHDIPAGQSRCRECGPADDAPILRPLVSGVTR